MSHRMSFQCYLEARNDSNVPPRLYADLESLVEHFARNQEDVSPEPEPFSFRSSAPLLLIVEDENVMASMLMEKLVACGYPENAIVLFSSGEEAIAYVQEHAVGIALVDVKLSNPLSVRGVYTSGLQVLRAIKDTSPGARVILISGFATYGMVREALLELGASYFLKKPFRLDDLVYTVHWGLERVLGAEVTRVVSGKNGDDPQPVPAGKEREHILVVDDDLPVAEGLALTLRLLGYRVSTAIGGVEALRRLDEGPVDALLLDVKMPHVDGLEVLRRLSGKRDKPIVLVLTALENEAVAREAIRLGAYEFLIKPCDVGVLQLTLECAFAQHAPGGDRE